MDLYVLHFSASAECSRQSGLQTWHEVEVPDVPASLGPAAPQPRDGRRISDDCASHGPTEMLAPDYLKLRQRSVE